MFSHPQLGIYSKLKETEIEMLVLSIVIVLFMYAVDLWDLYHADVIKTSPVISYISFFSHHLPIIAEALWFVKDTSLQTTLPCCLQKCEFHTFFSF